MFIIYLALLDSGAEKKLCLLFSNSYLMLLLKRTWVKLILFGMKMHMAFSYAIQ